MDYVVKNGIIKAKELTEEPFRNISSIIEVFDTETALKIVNTIVNTIEEINENATNIIGV